MTKAQAIQQYVEIPYEEKVSFLLALSNRLTVSGRDFYNDISADHQKKLIGINELQHHLSAEARHLYKRDDKRYPDDVLINILLEKAEYYGLEANFAYIIQQVLNARTQ